MRHSKEGVRGAAIRKMAIIPEKSGPRPRGLVLRYDLAAVAGDRWLIFGCILALVLSGGAMQGPTSMPVSIRESWTVVEGGVTRGDLSGKQLALIFTGGDFGEGSGHILDVLKSRQIRAGFFVTGDFIRKADHGEPLRRMIDEGHYLGPHSDSHPLYCPWEDRSKTLVSEEFFKSDLQKNIDDLKKLGALKDSGWVYFIPPYEWYNEDQARWSSQMGVFLFNFTPGSGSNRDWAPEGHKSFAPSQKIMDDILAFEQKDPNGLSGFILLLHLGADRKDKAYLLLEPLIEELRRRGYAFVRIDELLPLNPQR
jgi:peptidoglycan/xylan/chitin deacetylase (PgdA/CDA1 family)